MKDFLTHEERGDLVSDQAGWDDGAMTHQGFKRFRRRRGLRQDPVAEQPVLEPTLHGMGADVHLPAPLPEPWDLLRRIPIGVREHQEARSPLVNFFRKDPAAKAFDQLRTRLLHTVKAQGWKSIAVSAPFYGCGSTFTAVNLALSLARIPGSRTVLMDLNHRAPGIGQALKIRPEGGMARFLSGELAMEDYLIKPAETLALGLAEQPRHDSSDALHDPICAAVLEDMTARTGADVVIYDLPPVLEHDDVTAFLPQVDGVLLVSDGTQTTAADLEQCEKALGDAGKLLGVVLNRARKPMGRSPRR